MTGLIREGKLYNDSAFFSFLITHRTATVTFWLNPSSVTFKNRLYSHYSGQTNTQQMYQTLFIVFTRKKNYTMRHGLICSPLVLFIHIILFIHAYNILE